MFRCIFDMSWLSRCCLHFLGTDTFTILVHNQNILGLAVCAILPKPSSEPLAQNQTNSEQFYKRTISFFKSFELYTKWQLQGTLQRKYTKCLDERCVVKYLHRIVKGYCPSYFSLSIEKIVIQINFSLPNDFAPSFTSSFNESYTIFYLDRTTCTESCSMQCNASSRVCLKCLKGRDFLVFTLSSSQAFSVPRNQDQQRALFVYKYLSFSNKNIN